MSYNIDGCSAGEKKDREFSFKLPTNDTCPNWQTNQLSKEERCQSPTQDGYGLLCYCVLIICDCLMLEPFRIP